MIHNLTMLGSSVDLRQRSQMFRVWELKLCLRCSSDRPGSADAHCMTNEQSQDRRQGERRTMNIARDHDAGCICMERRRMAGRRVIDLDHPDTETEIGS
jgi:hypothetical protein